MSSYRYIFLNSSDHVADFHVIACENDTQAQARADRLLAAFGFPGVEDRGRRVYRAQKAADPA